MGAMAARIESFATDAAAIAAIMATTAQSGRVSMRSWLHSRMCKRVTASASRSNECEARANFYETFKEGAVQANSNEPK
jgi:hypothetical protein